MANRGQKLLEKLLKNIVYKWKRKDFYNFAYHMRIKAPIDEYTSKFLKDLVKPALFFEMILANKPIKKHDGSLAMYSNKKYKISIAGSI